MKPRTFHLIDFPNNIYVYLEGNFRKSLFEMTFKKIGSRKEVSKLIGTARQTLEGWYLGKRLNGKREVLIPTPLWAIQSLIRLTSFTNLDALDKHVIFIRLESRKIIRNPKLPLEETPTLLSLIGNIIGDGYAPKTRDTPNYTNRCKSLIREFKKKLKIFGNVPTSYEQDANYIRFPKIIIHILNHFYNFESSTFNASLPEILWKLPKEFSAAIIGAIIDDDGTICDDKIEVYSASKKLLEDFKNLICKKFPKIKTGEIKEKGKNYFFFQIHAESFEYVYKFIPIKHPEKLDDLRFNVRRQKLRPVGVTLGKNTTKRKIIELLSKRDLTAKEISRMLFIGRSTINEHLNKLEQTDKITAINVNGKTRRENCRLWRISDGARRVR